MTSITWTATNSAPWATNGDWSTHTVPTPADDVTIAIPNVTVTVNVGAQAARSITTTDSTLALTGGSLSIGSFATLHGDYKQSGGTLYLGGTGGTFFGSLTMTGGTIISRATQFSSLGGFSQSAGLLALYGSGGTFGANFVQSAGTVRVGSGTLTLNGASNSIGGIITGGGLLLVAGNAQSPVGTTTVQTSAVLSISEISVTSGVLALAGNGTSQTLTLGHYFSATSTGTVAVGKGNTLALDGRAELGADFTAGTILANGGGQINNLTLDNGAALEIGSVFTLTEAGNTQPAVATLRSGSQIDIRAGATLRLTGNDTIADSTNDSLVFDNGLLSHAGGTGTAEIAPSFTETSIGTITTAIGTVDFSGQTNEFAGTIGGAGTFSLGAAGTTTSDVFDPGLVLNSAAFVLAGANTKLSYNFSNSTTYTGAWTQTGGLFLLGSGGQTLTLHLDGGVVLDGGVIKSSVGTIATAGLVNLGNNQPNTAGIAIEAFTTFNVGADGASVVDQTQQIQLGASSSSKPVATIFAGSTWNLEDGASINGTLGTLNNKGSLIKLNGAGVSPVNGALASTLQGTLISTGTIDVDSSSLILAGSGTLGGTIAGAGTLALEGAGTYFLEPGLSLAVADILVDNPLNLASSVVEMTQALTYGGIWAQHGGSLQLNAQTLTLTGTSALDGGKVTGVGVLNLAGAATIGSSPNSSLDISGGATVDISRASAQAGNIVIDGGATLDVLKTGSLGLLDSENIGGTGTLRVDGILGSNGAGLSMISDSLVLTGFINVNAGELQIMGGVTGATTGHTVTAGAIAIHSGARLDLMSAVGTLGAASQPVINMGFGNASLALYDAAAFNGVISGFAAGDFIEITGLASGLITPSLDATGKILTIQDSSNHTFTIDFAQKQTLLSFGSTGSGIEIGVGPHGYLGIFHT